MKKLILTLFFSAMAAGTVLNASTQESKKNKSEEDADHYYCKAQGLSVAYTVAGITGNEPKVSDFLSAYKNCMGY